MILYMIGQIYQYFTSSGLHSVQFIYSTYPPTAVLNTSPNLVSGILVGVTHNLELPTERKLPFSLSTSTPVLSPVTTSTGLVHALCYGFIIFVLSYSVTLLDVRPEAPVHNWCVSAYLCRDCVIRYCLLYTFLLTVITDSPRETTAGRRIFAYRQYLQDKPH